MKNYFLLFLLFIGFTLQAQQFRHPKVDEFSEVSLGIPGKAYVRQGNSCSVELEGPDDLLDEIETAVEGDKLIIRPKDRWSLWDTRDFKDITVRINLKQINGLQVSGSGDMLVMTRIKTDQLNLKVSGSGTLKAEVDAGKVRATISGSGNMVLRGAMKSLENNISGSGRLELNAAVAGPAAFNISGSGDVLARGSANEVETRISGSGKVLAADLESRICHAHISGSGTVEIHVTDELEAHISGSGDVRYTGNPTRVNAHSSGSGKVRRLNS